MGDRPLVLVVDDEPALTQALTASLGTRGYDVAIAPTGERGLAEAAARTPAVIVLDLGLPDIDGVEVCRRLREWSDAPVIVLTAEGSEDRKVQALDEGADDYVTKPFSTPELLARIRVALRHRRDRQAEPAVVRVGDVEIDFHQRRVRRGETLVTLTPKEFGFLAFLARYPGRVMTHRSILQAVWGPEYGTETQYLRVYASQLRKKLGDDADHPILVTEPGVGYRLVDPDQSSS